MTFRARYIEENVNVSRTHPLVELAWLLGGLIVVVGVLFLILGLLSDWAVARMPTQLENWLGQKALEQFPGDDNSALNQRLQALLTNLPADSPLKNSQFRIFLAESDEVNAIALPGGTIVVFSGLLDQIESENELAMILGHELGHFAHRDHLRGLGRGLGVTVASALLFGKDSAASELLANTLLTFQSHYSRKQEQAADSFGLDLLVQRYGHCGGATDFFSRLATEKESKLPYLLASHPHPQDRIDRLNQRIEQQGYPMADVQPLGPELRTATDN